MWCRCGRGEPSPGADVAAASPVAVQMWQRRAQLRCRCGSGEPSCGADVAGASPVAVQMWQRRAQLRSRCGRGEQRFRCGRGEPSPGADASSRVLVAAQLFKFKQLTQDSTSADGTLAGKNSMKVTESIMFMVQAFPGLPSIKTMQTPPIFAYHIRTRTGLTPTHIGVTICTGTGLTAATSAPGLGLPLATSAPGLGSPRATSAPGLGSPLR
jgi:hypothetical protein